MELVLQISDIFLLIFGDSQITLIFAQKKVSFNFREKKDGIGAANLWHSYIQFLRQSNHFNFRQNIGTFYVLQISVIPSLILVTVLSLWFSQKDEVHLHFRKWWWKKLQTLAGKWIRYPTSVIPTPGGSQCTGVSPTLSWKWPRATLSPSFGPFFERNHSFGVKMVSQNFPKCFKSCPWSWNPTGKKQIYTTGKRSYRTGHICKLFHFALSLLNSEIAITPERVARLTWFFGSMPKIEIYDHLIF